MRYMYMYYLFVVTIHMLIMLSLYRWWPAEVISDNCIPCSLCSSKPSACMFLVRFFGTEQYFWTHHGRVIAFTEECLLQEHKKKSYGINTKQGQIQAQYIQGIVIFRVLSRNNLWVKLTFNHVVLLHTLLIFDRYKQKE